MSSTTSWQNKLEAKTPDTVSFRGSLKLQRHMSQDDRIKLINNKNRKLQRQITTREEELSSMKFKVLGLSGEQVKDALMLHGT